MMLISNRVFYFLIFFLLNTLSLNGQKQNDIIYAITDTSELKKVINVQLEKSKNSQTINQDSMISLLVNALQLKDTLSAVEICNKVAIVYRYNQEDKDAIQWLKECIRLLQTPDQKYAGQFYNTIGNFYRRLGYEIDALKYFFKSLEWYKRYNVNNSTYALGNIARIYFNMEDYDKALEYGLEAKSYSVKIEDKENRLYNIAHDYSDIGAVYFKLNKNDEAAVNFKKSIQAARELNDSALELYFSAEFLGFFMKMKEYDKCQNLINEGDRLVANNDIEDIRSLINFEISKSEYFLETNQISKAIHPEELNMEAEFLFKKKNEYAIKYYDSIEDPKNVKNHFEILLSGLEKRNRDSRRDVMANIEIEYQAKELQNENTRLEEVSKNRTNIIYFILALLCMISGLYLLQRYNNNKTKRLNLSLESKTKELEKSNGQLATSNEELERFNFIASHDLKTPLRSIISWSGYIQKKQGEIKDESILDALDFIHDGGVQMHELIEGVEFYTGISEQIKKGSQIYKTIGLDDLLAEVTELPLGQTKEKNAYVELHSSLPFVKRSAAVISVLFENIIKNGLQYNQSNIPVVKITGKKDDAFYSVFFEDNGIGIKQEYLDSIFKMFTRLHTQVEYKGSGLGLATCRKIITELGGKINVESEVGKGTIFEVQMPIELFDNENHVFAPKVPIETFKIGAIIAKT